MPRYMLDTNIVSDLLRNPQGRIFERITKVGASAVCISIITAAELQYGVIRRGSSKLTHVVDGLLDRVTIEPLGPPSDVHYGSLRAELEAKGQTIGPNDMLIAAQACALNVVLVTANEREFSRVIGLRVENWLR